MHEHICGSVRSEAGTCLVSCLVRPAAQQRPLWILLASQVISEPET
jgi:hypothetical protein